MDPGDNGIYVIEGWAIVERIGGYDYGSDGYDHDEMLRDIDKSQPEDQQLGAYLDADVVPVSDLSVGDRVYMRNTRGNMVEHTVVGFGSEGSIVKRDLESGLPTSLGAANLDGTRFEVKSLNEDPVICGGVTFQKGEVITELTIKNGEASTAADLLPFGRYTIQEVAVGDGYLLTDGKAHEFDISKDGQIVNGVEGAVKNQVKRGDLEFVKVSEADMSRLAGVPFRITSETTGESHVIVTDENGYASTAAEWNKHTHKTNANDTAAEEDLDSEAGIWFGLAKDGKGDSVVVFETLYRDGKEITAHADIDDEGQTVEFTEPSLGTTAEDGIDGDQSLVADGKAVIVDNVSYKGLVPGKEYKVVGTLMLKDTGEPLLDANGKSVTAETTFTPDHDHGTVDVTFTFDASLLAGQQVVVFETLYRLDKEITVHADIEDENQTIEVIQPGVDTVAVDGFDGDKDVVADPEAEITDTLSYKNVIPGSTYEVHGILMDAETGLPLLSGEGADKVGEDELTDFWHELCDLTGITSAKPLEPVYGTETTYHTVCNTCNALIDGNAAQHIEETGHSGYSTDVPIVNEVVVQSGYYEQVLVKEAWDETVQTGSVCASCGEEKPLEGGAA